MTKAAYGRKCLTGAYSSRGIRIHPAGRKCLHLYPQTEGEEHTGVVGSFENLSPAPVTQLPQQRPHLLILPLSPPQTAN